MVTLTEYFLLREAQARATKTPEPERKAMAEALRAGQQKGDAAETLWSNGHLAEGLRMAAQALEESLRAADRRAEAEPPATTPPDAGEAPAETPAAEAAEKDTPPAPPGWREALQARGLSASALDAIASAEQSARAGMPRFDSEIEQRHAELYQQLKRARASVRSALVYASMSPGDLRGTSIARSVTALMIAAVILSIVVVTSWPSSEVRYEASDYFGRSPQFHPPHAFDGNRDTEWLLPDSIGGWVEVHYPSVRRVSRVQVLNARNPPYYDRATREYRLELYSGDRVLRQIQGSFNFSREPEQHSHAVDVDGVDRVRLVVINHHNLGAGIAEISVE